MLTPVFSRQLPHTAEAQRYIYSHQHPSACENRNWVTFTHHAGIGSEIHVATAALAFAIIRDAIFVWPKSRWMTAACQKQSFECVYQPATNCTNFNSQNRLLVTPDTPGLWNAVPAAFRNVSSPYPLLYWWRAQGAAYLVKFTNEFNRTLLDLSNLFIPRQVPCNSACVYVRHGDKYKEMEMLPWNRFFVALNNLSEHRAEDMPFCQSSAHMTVFLMTDDHAVARAAKADLKEHMMFINHSVLAKLPHEEGGNATDSAMWENFRMSMLNFHFCVQCSAVISQRQANFARLIDEMRITTFHKFGEPFIEVGAQFWLAIVSFSLRGEVTVVKVKRRACRHTSEGFACDSHRPLGLARRLHARKLPAPCGRTKPRPRS